ncbi:cyanase [Mangrovibrevibacter kandeliae]|uniref:cyanase n=1 Tax=Mangrovibrevibacter kandeliae TaxID=2968473 RepID=UPI002117F72E|nr:MULTISPECIES: cyanase [unclassified Aurantimonas]MCQ8782078.1 cyanase [Aurantimonas sp. CSK15Z-1]MCW4115262.1 cyanase [Aurantimonas sp. MSK8Z-1]
MMTKQDVTEMVYERKRASGMTWHAIAEAIGMSEVFTTSACLGMNSLPKDKAEALVTTLGLPQEAAIVLSEYPTKIFDQTIPTDPCVYRFYEIMGVYGKTIKELIQEKCGDGIMSAIDFEMDVERVPHEKGDRIEVRMSGKYLGYKAW